MPEKHLDEILFIDDSNDEAFITELILKREQIQLKLIHCPDYASAASYLHGVEGSKPALVLVDLNMPKLNGIQFIEKLYAEFDRSKIIAGIFSGSQDPQDRLDALNAGAKFFLEKPVSTVFLQNLCEVLSQFELKLFDDGSKKILINS